jgi:hypothetical protein
MKGDVFRNLKNLSIKIEEKMEKKEKEKEKEKEKDLPNIIE